METAMRRHQPEWEGVGALQGEHTMGGPGEENVLPPLGTVCHHGSGGISREREAVNEVDEVGRG